LNNIGVDREMKKFPAKERACRPQNCVRFALRIQVSTLQHIGYGFATGQYQETAR
jgi:hypothetical protein